MKTNSMKFGAFALLLLAALSVSFVACSNDEYYYDNGDLTLAERVTRSGGEAPGEITIYHIDEPGSVQFTFCGDSTMVTFNVHYRDGNVSPFRELEPGSGNIWVDTVYAPIRADYSDRIMNIKSVRHELFRLMWENYNAQDSTIALGMTYRGIVKWTNPRGQQKTETIVSDGLNATRRIRCSVIKN